MRTMNARANAQPSRQPRPALTRRESARLSVATANITSQRFPKMSKAALDFAREMLANPHVQVAMRDLADK